jgi:hypothetical protein
MKQKEQKALVPQLFNLIKEEFSKIDNEKQWTYLCLFSLYINRKKINKITITDHTWKKKGRENITKELILDILKEELNSETVKKSQYFGNRKPFVKERIEYQEKKYKIVFWFEKNNTDWLWIRVCHQQD